PPARTTDRRGTFVAAPRAFRMVARGRPHETLPPQLHLHLPGRRPPDGRPLVRARPARAALLSLRPDRARQRRVGADRYRARAERRARPQVAPERLLSGAALAGMARGHDGGATDRGAGLLGARRAAHRA